MHGEDLDNDGKCDFCAQKIEYNEDLVYNLKADNTYEITGYVGSDTEIIIPSTYLNKAVTAIGDGAFSGCTSIETIIVPSSVTAIGANAFVGCGNLVHVSLTDSIEKLGKNTFEDSVAFRFNVINGVKYIGNTKQLHLVAVGLANDTITNITLEKDCQVISASAFRNGGSLVEVTINNLVTSIPEWSFAYCTSLRTITLGEKVTTIENYAFYSCYRLTTISGYKSLEELGDWVFYDCKLLPTAPFDATNALRRIGTGAFVNCETLTSVVIPDTITKINNLTFSGCKALESVTIGKAVKEIGSKVFENCTSLTSITIPQSVTHLNTNVFSGCSNLVSIDFVDSSTWYVTTNQYDWQLRNEGILVDVSSKTDNPNKLIGEGNYSSYYWYKE